MVGGNPTDPELTTQVHIRLVVDGPAVRRATRSSGPIDQIGMFAQSLDRRPDRRSAHSRRRTAADAVSMASTMANMVSVLIE